MSDHGEAEAKYRPPDYGNEPHRCAVTSGGDRCIRSDNHEQHELESGWSWYANRPHEANEEINRLRATLAAERERAEEAEADHTDSEKALIDSVNDLRAALGAAEKRATEAEADAADYRARWENAWPGIRGQRDRARAWSRLWKRAAKRFRKCERDMKGLAQSFWRTKQGVKAERDTAQAEAEALRQRVEELDKLENEGNHRYGEVCAERDALRAEISDYTRTIAGAKDAIESLEAKLATARQDALEEAAKVLDRAVAEHLSDLPPLGWHGHCEDFGCGSLEEYAKSIRALATADTEGETT